MKIFIKHIIIFLFFLTSTLFGQYSEYEVKAAYLKNFTIFIDWPEHNEISDDSRPFKILVLGTNPFDNILNDLSDDISFKNRKLVVDYEMEIKNLDYDIIFICKDKDDELDSILARINGVPILTIGDTEGYAEKGVHINFYETNNNVLFEVNRKAAQKDGFVISSRLLKLARIVNNGGG